ncbi:hypothetical protein [Colwellia sp. C1TZA3]|uniref:hypothetical protein n=1 Tax=Colwellia sp. C1TZA3 TaxID=2508879 RepID=UPI0011B9ED26|nr:hypothetical protein [Colwellia sp. C1TZA3]TWX71388.1 hypothetical protein ESZ39_09770 [Colwellia sp. C1TZA3]
MQIKTIKNILLLSLSYIFLVGCTNIVEHKVSVFKGENLITPYSGFLAGWYLSIENKENYQSRIWQHPVYGFKDAYVISVTLPEDKKIAYFRQVIDQPGYDACAEFTTLTLQSSPDEPYPSEIWQTNCKKKNGSEAKILHLMLLGKDSFYHVQKIWQDRFISNAIEQWQSRFKQIYLCDSRATVVVCPDVYSL